MLGNHDKNSEDLSVSHRLGACRWTVPYLFGDPANLIAIKTLIAPMYLLADRGACWPFRKERRRTATNLGIHRTDCSRRLAVWRVPGGLFGKVGLDGHADIHDIPRMWIYAGITGLLRLIKSAWSAAAWKITDRSKSDLSRATASAYDAGASFQQLAIF
jgi:hypothetical protein